MRRLPAAIAALVLAVAAAPAAADPGPALHVDAQQDRHAISPDIYGINFADQALANEIDLPVDRWGGNLFEAYNWQLGSTNFASDNYFENAADCFIFTASCDSGNEPYYRTFVARARARQTKPLITLPAMGYIAKDAPQNHPFTCSYTQPDYPPQDGYDPYDPPCGNGRQNGQAIAGTPTRAGVAAGAQWSADWVDDLKGRGVELYGLGNEPGLWHETHSDMHPARTTYDELAATNIALATAVKQRQPSAKVLAFGEWGWPNYFCSAADNPDNGCSATSPDRAAHGGKPLVNWLLEQLATASAEQGMRLADYIDVHYYAQGHDPDHPIDHTRSLWDPTYVDPSWIDTQIRLLPRMKEWVAADYPGTKTALSEYDLSLRGDVPGKARLNVLIEADVLGIFGREGLDLATFFDTTPGRFLDQAKGVADAFRLYRNYDGRHSRFGDVSVKATSGDQSRVAVYAAQRSSDSKLTIAVVNKEPATQSSTLAIDGFSAASAETWRWDGDVIARAPDTALGAGAIDFPARSLTLLVASKASGGPGPGTGPGGPTHNSRRCRKVPGGLVGKKLKQARKRLRRRGCMRPRVHRVHARRHHGRVLATHPRAGRPLGARSRITLRVAR